MYIKKPKAILNATSYRLIVTEAPVHDEQVHYCIVTQYMCRLEEHSTIHWAKKKISFNISTDIAFSCNKADIEFFQP